MNFTFRVDEKIRGKARPRFNVYTKKVYTTPQDREYEALIKQSYLASDGIYFGDDTYIRAEIELYFAVPKSYTKKRRLRCIENKERPNKKPDIDNILKSVFDAIQGGISFHDDTQVIEVEAKKYYTDEAQDYMIIKLVELEGGK